MSGVRRSHPINALTAIGVRNMKTPGRYCDGNGLYLIVDPSGAKRWVLRTVIKGQRTDLGLGSARLVSLSDARADAVIFRRQARAGGDPRADRRKARRRVPSFAEAAEAVHAERGPTFRNPKHAAQWIQTLKTYVFPVFGDAPVDQIQSSHVLKALAPIWLEKPETARRIKQRIEAVLDWAKAHGFTSGDNPATHVNQILPRQSRAKQHFAAMPYAQVPKFVASLSEASTPEVIRLGLELLILTALRTKELRLGEWSEVDWQAETWTIPPDRQLKKKNPTPHVVPLSPRCIAILRRLQRLSAGSRFIFPGKRSDQAISDMTLLMALRRLGYKITNHGFRSSFRDWASEETNHRHEVIEKSMAHEIPNQVEAAYRRGDLLGKRRALMIDWAEFVSSRPAMAEATL